MADLSDTMADTSNGNNNDLDGDDGSITLGFSLAFNAAKCAVWWSLWLIALAYALARRRVVSRAWFIYMMLLSVICFNGIQTTAYVGFASHALRGHSGLAGYLVYRLFFNVSRSAFLAVLMVVASGYCITRSDLGPHKPHVVFVPTTVLVTGVITDLSVFALLSSPDSDTYDLTTMGTLAASLWFVCAVLNLSALILAWLYIFEALGKETSALEEEYQLRTGQQREEPLAVDPQGLTANTISRAAAGYTPAAGAPSAALDASSDVEADDARATVADHLAYEAKKKLLSRFALGVAAYLISDICVLLLPAFFNHIVQSTLQVLLFVCYLAFIVVLLILFRPQEQSTYLMVGFSEEDAEKRGVNQLLTGIAMGDLEFRHHDADSDDDISRLRGAPLAHTTQDNNPAEGQPGPHKSAIRTAARAVKKADKEAARYGQLSDVPDPAGAGRSGAGALPVSSAFNPSGSVSSTSVPSSYRGRPPKKYVPQQPTEASGQFTLDDEEEEQDHSSRLLGGGKGTGV